MIFLGIPIFRNDLGGLVGFGDLGLVGQEATQAPLLFNRVISTAIGIMSIVAFVWFMIQIVLAGIQIISAGGDKNKVAEARGKIISGITGVIVVISAVFLAELIGRLLGFSLVSGGNWVVSLGI